MINERREKDSIKLVKINEDNKEKEERKKWLDSTSSLLLVNLPFPDSAVSEQVIDFVENWSAQKIQTFIKTATKRGNKSNYKKYKKDNTFYVESYHNSKTNSFFNEKDADFFILNEINLNQSEANAAMIIWNYEKNNLGPINLYTIKEKLKKDSLLSK